jgi:hypothetical protein
MIPSSCAEAQRSWNGCSHLTNWQSLERCTHVLPCNHHIFQLTSRVAVSSRQFTRAVLLALVPPRDEHVGDAVIKLLTKRRNQSLDQQDFANGRSAPLGTIPYFRSRNFCRSGGSTSHSSCQVRTMHLVLRSEILTFFMIEYLASSRSGRRAFYSLGVFAAVALPFSRLTYASPRFNSAERSASGVATCTGSPPAS